MKRYLVDANMPYYFSLWRNEAYEHVIDIDPRMTDSAIWAYAKAYRLTIITKDADFSDRILLNDPPPRVIHIRFGNMKMKEFHATLARLWHDVLSMSEKYKLVIVYKEKIEGIG